MSEEPVPIRFYLEKYFSYIGPENDAMNRALQDLIAAFSPSLDSVLDLSEAGALASLIVSCAACGRAPGLVCAPQDNPEAIAELRAFLTGQPDAFGYPLVWDWVEHFVPAPPRSRLEEQMRSARWELSPPGADEKFTTALVPFTAQEAGSREGMVRWFAERVAPHLDTGSFLHTAFMIQDQGFWEMGAVRRQLAPISGAQDVVEVLGAAGIELSDFRAYTIEREYPPVRPGYEGVVVLGGVVGDPASGSASHQVPELRSHVEQQRSCPPDVYQNMWRFFSGVLEGQKVASILDLGCGDAPGAALAALAGAEPGCTVHFVDSDLDRLTLMPEAFTEDAGLVAEVLQSDNLVETARSARLQPALREWRMPLLQTYQKAFDVVIAAFSLQSIARADGNLLLALQKLLWCLRPGGAALLALERDFLFRSPHDVLDFLERYGVSIDEARVQEVPSDPEASWTASGGFLIYGRKPL